MKSKTSWDKSAKWYEEFLASSDTYQARVILPNILRLLSIKKGEVILDLACGPGFFSQAMHEAGAKVIGIDVSKNLIETARKNSPKEIEYHITSADKMTMIHDKSISKIVIILALQNIKNLNDVLAECYRVLKPTGKLFIVMNHPAFRIPQATSWGWDEGNQIQYRRVDRYLSELKSKIQMHPGDKPKEITLSFHRPLQSYFKSLDKSGFCVGRLEEWISDKKSESGPKSRAENRARSEIPLFLFMEAIK